MRTQIAILVGALAGCGNGGAEQPDAGMPVDSTKSDASSICDPTGKFDAPVPLTEINTARTEGFPRLTADELELYFSSNLGTSDINIYRAQRSTVSQPFGAPMALAPVNTAVADDAPSVSSDGLMLFFSSSRVSGEGTHLYVSTRASRVGEFGAPSEVANVNSGTVTNEDTRPFVTADGQELWFNSDRMGGLDVYRAVWNGSSFGNVELITSLPLTRAVLPVLSADKLTVYFSMLVSPDLRSHIWTAHRSTTSDGFPAPRLVPELNSIASDYVGWLSPDNCRIYLSSDRAGAGGSDIYVATRHPVSMG